MSTYILRRLLLNIPVLLVVTMVLFLTTRALPGDYALQQMAQSPFVDSTQQLREELGIDRPLPEQYVRWMAGVVRGDLGRSFQTNQPVMQELRDRIPVTLELATISILIALMVGVPIGIISAVKQDHWLDYALRLFAISALAIPGFWLATVFLLLPAIWWDWSPPARYVSFTDDPAQNLQIMLLPALVGSIGASATIMRILRSQLLEVLRQDYVRTAWSKGLRHRTVIVRHALKNALIPVVTVLGIVLSTQIGGSVILETIFNLPGIGQYAFRSINVRDYPVVQGVVLVVAVGLVMINLFIDVLYAWLDPRIRLGR